MTRLKYVADLIAGQSPPSDDVDLLGEGQPFLQGNAEFGPTHPTPRYECSAPPKQCKQGDILLSVRAPVGAVNVADQAYGIGRGLCAIRPHAAVPTYLRWWLQHSRADLEVLATGSTFAAVSAPVVGGLEVPNLTPSQQRAIAEYLDRATGRIDTLIEEQQRLIGRLRERRWAVVERSVAHLDWDTPFRAVAVLIQTGPFGSQLKSEEYEEGGTPIINPSHIAAGEILPDSRIAVGADKAGELARHAFQEGDLVSARRGELGRCAVVGPSAAGFLCGTGSALIRLNKAVVEPSFASLVFSSRRNREALSLASVGSTMDNLNSDIIGSLRIPVPKLEEQRELVGQVVQATSKIDTLIGETERFIELARERRAALITAAVTGQVDARAVA